MPQCLVVPRKNLESLSSWKELQASGDIIHVLIPLHENDCEEFLHTVRQYGEFKERFGDDGVEKNPDMQQVIFYGLIVRGNTFFVYKRGDEGMSEKRLSSKISVGVGGHIEPSDASLINSLYRELDEEVSFVKNGNPINFRNESGEINLDAFHAVATVEIKGLIKNDTDDVGKVHVGLFCVIRVIADDIDVKIKNEQENVLGSFMSKEDYDAHINAGEYVPEAWTQLVLESELFPCK